MSTDLEAQVRGLRDRQGFSLPHFYGEANASPELVHRLKRASEHIDTWTWKELCQQELEHVQFDEVKRTPEDSGQRLLYRQSLSQPGVGATRRGAPEVYRRTYALSAAERCAVHAWHENTS